MTGFEILNYGQHRSEFGRRSQ